VPDRSGNGSVLRYDREVDDPTEAAAVRAGWQLVDAYERLSNRAAARVFGHELDAWHEYAASTVVKLTAPQGSKTAHVHENRNNTLRYRRTMDFAREGDRVFDVGFGDGYLAAQLLLVRKIASYDGIDIVDTKKSRVQRMFAANGLGDVPIGLEQGDLYELTRERLEGHQATLVYCCEVLEHVPDAEHALRVLADALPEGADLVFSVPLHGRIENVWGHVSVFDVDRIKGMLDQAGLYAHHVEPLANVWTLVVANRNPAPSERVRQATSRPPTRVSAPLSTHRDFVYVSPGEITPVAPTAAGQCEITPNPKGGREVRCQVTGTGGTSFRVTGLEALRLNLNFHEAGRVNRILVIANRRGSEVGSWVWEPAGGELAPGIRSFALRPGQWSSTFVGRAHSLPDADRVDLIVEQPRGEQTSFSVRTAYLP
jgi:2-polyprenyl-3-methyl-5-hydroxy-6-metoxy-1,4-benzoquinol methylase